MSTRPQNGGLINLQELCTMLRQKRKSDREAVSEDDCLRAISKLKVRNMFTMTSFRTNVIMLISFQATDNEWF